MSRDDVKVVREALESLNLNKGGAFCACVLRDRNEPLEYHGDCCKKARLALAALDRIAAPGMVKLRSLLAASYAGAMLYNDDGELQDNREQPFIDFLRDSPDEIERKMSERGLNSMNRALASQPEPAAVVQADPAWQTMESAPRDRTWIMLSWDRVPVLPTVRYKWVGGDKPWLDDMGTRCYDNARFWRPLTADERREVEGEGKPSAGLEINDGWDDDEKPQPAPCLTIEEREAVEWVHDKLKTNANIPSYVKRGFRSILARAGRCEHAERVDYRDVAKRWQGKAEVAEARVERLLHANEKAEKELAEANELLRLHEATQHNPILRAERAEKELAETKAEAERLRGKMREAANSTKMDIMLKLAPTIIPIIQRDTRRGASPYEYIAEQLGATAEALIAEAAAQEGEK